MPQNNAKPRGLQAALDWEKRTRAQRDKERPTVNPYDPNPNTNGTVQVADPQGHNHKMKR
jgi:hypothetical protein